MVSSALQITLLCLKLWKYYCLYEMVQDADLTKIFIIDGTEARINFRTKPHTKKFERLIEVKAFLNTQALLGIRQEDEVKVLPSLVKAREQHAQLVKDVQSLNAVSPPFHPMISM